MLGKRRAFGETDADVEVASGKRSRSRADDPCPLRMDVDAHPIGRAHSQSFPLPALVQSDQQNQQIVLYQPKAEMWSLAGLMQELSPALKRRDDGTMGVDVRMLHRIVSRLPPEAQQRVEAAWRQVVDLYHARGAPLPNVHAALPPLPPLVITDISDGRPGGNGCGLRDPGCVVEEVDSEVGEGRDGSMAGHQQSAVDERLVGEAMDVD